MLPASDIAEIISNLASLKLEPTTTAAVLGAVLAPLLREDLPRRHAAQPRAKPRTAPRQKRKKFRPRMAAAGEPTDSPRQRARAALQANPGVSLNAVAKVAGVNRGTVVNARNDLAAAARKEARKQARKQRETAPSNPSAGAAMAKQTDRRARAQRFLKDALAQGPKRVSDLEEAAEKAHVDPHALEQARADLGIVTSRGNAGNTLAVQWSLPAG